MFGTSKTILTESLEKIRKAMCCYGGSDHMYCDCKYGFEKFIPGTEKCGCPELRMASRMFKAMTYIEFQKIAKRADILIH